MRENSNIYEIVKQMGLGEDPACIQITPFQHEEDDEYYEVWKITAGGKEYVLKKAKGQEQEIYAVFLKEMKEGVPHLYQSLHWQGDDYLLMEYISGKDLCRCDRQRLTRVLDALIAIQEAYWKDVPQGHSEYNACGYTYAQSMESRKDRGRYLKKPELEQAYGYFLKLYDGLPCTLCHNDLLPFNALVDEERAVIIDWETAGILPYPTSLARLIAHGEETEEAFFYMTDADKEYAINYYYDHLIKYKEISYESYRRTMDYFLLYEYCEWIMLGNKYEDADRIRYEQYQKKAEILIKSKNL